MTGPRDGPGGEPSDSHSEGDEKAPEGSRDAPGQPAGEHDPVEKRTSVGDSDQEEPEIRPAIRRRNIEDKTDEFDDIDEWKLLVRDVVTSIVAVMLVGGYLFAVSGVFPPMVAVESGSMIPNMEVNDLVFVMDEDRFPPEAAQGETGIVTAQTGREVGYEQFGGYGDVIIFAPRGDENQTPVIHRSMFWVSEDEDWYEKADSEYVGTADSCIELSGCPADHAGFITKGDNNPRYDQAGPGRLSEPVKPEWIIGTAEVRIPGLGWLRLRF